MKGFLFGAFMDLFILGAFYLFLCFSNWSFHPMEWHGFARFIMGVAILWYIIELNDDYQALKRKRK